MDGENGVVVDYTYDDSGNILSKVTRSWNNNFTSPVLGSVVSNITYSYTDAEWKDLLTNYNGQTLTYDANTESNQRDICKN